MATMFELGTDGPTKILVGIDGSETALRAGAYAAGMARRQSSRLIVLYVAPTGGLAAGMAATAGALIATHDDIANDLERQVEDACKRLGVPMSFVRRRGNPYLELVRVAEQLRVDAIVVGASMQSGHRLVGSLAGRLVRDAKWPVTVVP
ncbi:MAG TPA: universal stress protein [Jatrophihabitantaceae bacterium]|jgi:nucleotide-binding universal stress UspA family protein